LSSLSGVPLTDLLVVGGGINGVGIARDAAGRGLSVLLVERGDLAGATSSASSKLIHGGLRYLEQYEFRLVHESLAEREVLLAAAPYIIRPLRFVLPVHEGLRPPWLLRLGLFLYDHIGGRKRLPATRTVRREHQPVFAPLADGYRLGFEYSTVGPMTPVSSWSMRSTRNDAARKSSPVGRLRVRAVRAAFGSLTSPRGTGCSVRFQPVRW